MEQPTSCSLAPNEAKVVVTLTADQWRALVDLVDNAQWPGCLVELVAALKAALRAPTSEEVPG